VNLDQALQTYIAESRGLLEEMEDALLGLEHDPGNTDLIGALFRAAHTIKGSAGLFGLDAVVAFTHVVESLLDQLREGKISASTDLIGTLLECRDHIGALIDSVAQAEKPLDAIQVAQEKRLLQALHMHLSDAEPTQGTISSSAVSGTLLQHQGDSSMALDHWHISLQFGLDVMRNGMDPASFIRYLATVGDITCLQLQYDNMPDIAAMDPQSCYLGFEIDLHSSADKKTIEDVFEFVRDDCHISILAPASHVARLMQQIESLESPVPSAPTLHTPDKLGEILCAADILTELELAQALAQQRALGASDDATPDVRQRQLGHILVSLGGVPSVAVDVALNKQKHLRENQSLESKFIRVHAEKLDQLINLVGELIIASASASLLALRSGNVALCESTSVISRFVEEIREDALGLRMVEIGETFSRFQRVVRDVSKDIGKDIGLEISGADTELDKTVVEKIGDPLTHLVRNAMDHGIESAQLRSACGKPIKGTVRLNAYHDSGSIVMEVADDGAGLNRDKILAKAIERGLVAPAVMLSDSEIYNLVFEPGFSTADNVTKLSGRGVGMDVVKRNIHALRGTVEIDSRSGIGTTVRIRLPLTLAIIDGFLVGVGSTSFVVPLDMVMECLELSEADRQVSRQHDYINLRGEVLPLISLRSTFSIAGDLGRRENVLVVKSLGKKAGLVVDTLLGEFQTVIKPLNKMFHQVKCISGSTILGSGDVALILDVPALIERASESSAPGTTPGVAVLHSSVPHLTVPAASDAEVY
jgi:two-component system chemotaxis sensor kinase CheA